MTAAERYATLIRESRGVAHKTDIAAVMTRLGIGAGNAIPVGDDMAVIPDPRGGNLLLSIEGFVADFVAADPWFAGYCGVMVNLSDVAAMGGEAIAIVDALWSDGESGAAPVLKGLRDAAERYGVPLVGGHSNLRAPDGQLAVAVLGRTEQPITSFDARPGDSVIVATDLRGRFRDPFPWWDASTDADPLRLREDLKLLPALANSRQVTSGKDISMAGVVGTAMMLAEASGVGMTIDLDALPKPDEVSLDRWLPAFPSFGFIVTARPDKAEAVIQSFASRDVACALVGTVETGSRLDILSQGTRACVWDFTKAFMGCASQSPTQELSHA